MSTPLMSSSSKHYMYIIISFKSHYVKTSGFVSTLCCVQVKLYPMTNKQHLPPGSCCCPVPIIGWHYKQMLQEDVWSTYVHFAPPLLMRKRRIGLYDISFNRIHWKLFKASVLRRCFIRDQVILLLKNRPTWSGYKVLGIFIQVFV